MNTLLSAIQLLGIFEGENIQIKLNKNLTLYSRIVTLFEKHHIDFETIDPLAPPTRFDLHFGYEINFQDLYILVSLLKNFGLQSVFLLSNRSSEICIGSYITECSPEHKRDLTQGLKPEDLLEMPFSTDINVFINEQFINSPVREAIIFTHNTIEFASSDESWYDDDDDVEYYVNEDSYCRNSEYYDDNYNAGNLRYDRNENPWIDVFGPGDEAEAAYWNTD